MCRAFQISARLTISSIVAHNQKMTDWNSSRSSASIPLSICAELPRLIENERERAESLSIRFINLPGSGWATPKDGEIAQFFSLVRERPRRKIFIHCWLGGDRSGMFVAAYRIAFEGWSPQQAIQEMRAFHYLHFWHPNMARWVKRFPDRLAQSPQLASFRQMRTQP